LEDLSIDGEMISKWIFDKWDWEASLWLRIGTDVGGLRKW
jgi:hypothetical protein